MKTLHRMTAEYAFLYFPEDKNTRVLEERRRLEHFFFALWLSVLISVLFNQNKCVILNPFYNLGRGSEFCLSSILLKSRKIFEAWCHSCKLHCKKDLVVISVFFLWGFIGIQVSLTVKRFSQTRVCESVYLY